MGSSLTESLQRGISFHQSGQLDEAILCYREALEVQPENTAVLGNLGVALRAQGKQDDAIASFRKVLEIKPDDARTLFNLGNAQKALGKLDEAVSSYQTAIINNPDFAEAHYNLGNALQEQGKLNEAIASYRQALACRPDEANTHYNLGKALRNQGRLNEAVSSYRKAIGINPQFSKAHQNLGNALKQQGKLDETVACFRKVANLRPDDAIAHFNLGIALKDFGQPEEAVSSFHRALLIKPDFAEARHVTNSILGHTTKSPPEGYVEKLFNAHAENFEHQLVITLEYKMPDLLKKVTADLGLMENTFKNVLDMGCGTGLAGVAFRDAAESLFGIDLSENMVLEAKKKNIYDQLHVNDIIAGLESMDMKFDLFISADVFVYIGDLIPLFSCVKKYAANDSLLIFSTEHSDSGNYILQQTGRYAHSKDYILSTAAETGFHLEYFTPAKLRKEKNAWIVGGIYILRNADPRI